MELIQKIIFVIPHTLLVGTEVGGADDLGLGLGVSQAAHFSSSGLFCIIHVSHSQLPTGFLNNVPKLLPVGYKVKQNTYVKTVSIVTSTNTVVTCLCC